MGSKRVGYVNPTDLSREAWKRDYEAGSRPDALPYGFNYLSPQFELEDVELRSRNVRDALRVLLPRPHAYSGGITLAWSERLALRAAARCGSRFGAGVIWITDEWPRLHPAKRLIFRRALSRADFLWVLSSAQVEPLRDITRGKVPIHFITFGVDTNFFTPSEPASKKVVLSVGNDQDRDVETLFSAYELIHEQHPEVELKARLDTNLTPPPFVTMLPRMTQRDLRREMHLASTVVVATNHNLHVSGMTTILEAGACGRPAVLTWTPGSDDYLQDGRTGLMAKGGDPLSVAEQALRLLGDAHLSADLGKSARLFVETKHSSKLMMDQFRNLIEMVG